MTFPMFSFLFLKKNPQHGHQMLIINFYNLKKKFIIIGFLPIALSQTLNAKVAKTILVLEIFSIPLQYQNFTSSSNPFFHNHVSLLLSLTNFVHFHIITYLVNFEFFSK
jgi:hypothetical protein